MTEARIGRLLGACLHQAIFDVLPDRLEFYEHFLRPDGLREGTIGLAPMTAVVGFLRTEGAAYDPVMARAGHLAAEWTVASLPAVRRRAIAWLPRGLRVRAALRVARALVRDVYATSRASTLVHRNQARVEVTSSLFCEVREVHAAPLCGFYLALIVETLRQFDVGAHGRLEQCHAVSGGPCVVTLELLEAVASPAPAVAA
jgi:hypothetical protein